MKTPGAVCEELVITIGVDGEMLDGCENYEKSYVDDVKGGFPDPEMVREARSEELAGYHEMQVYCRASVGECVFSQSDQVEVGRHKQRRQTISRLLLLVGGEGVDET